MKYYLNESSHRNLQTAIERYGEDLECVGYSNSTEMRGYSIAIGANTYYSFDIISTCKKIIINALESYQKMGPLRQWHFNRYEINVMFSGREPGNHSIHANIYDYNAIDRNQRQSSKMPIHMSSVINKSQSLYYTLFI